MNSKNGALSTEQRANFLALPAEQQEKIVSYLEAATSQTQQSSGWQAATTDDLLQRTDFPIRETVRQVA